jgi:hypothetical protein
MDYAGRFTFPAPAGQVWEAIERLDQFETWWGWLGHLEVEGSGLRPGSVLKGTVSPPVPYALQVEVALERCVQCQAIDAAVRGDLVGDAHLRLLPQGPDTVTEVAWSLEMTQLAMRLAARVAHPLLRWGHDRVVDATVDSFRRQLQRADPARCD